MPTLTTPSLKIPLALILTAAALGSAASAQTGGVGVCFSNQPYQCQPQSGGWNGGWTSSGAAPVQQVQPAPQWRSGGWQTSPPVYVDPLPYPAYPAYPSYPTYNPPVYNTYDDQYVDVYVDGRLVLSGVRQDEARYIQFGRRGRHQVVVVRAGYPYSQGVLSSRSYDAPRAGLNVQISFGEGFSLNFR